MKEGETRRRIFYGIIEWTTILGYAGTGLYLALVQRDIIWGGVFVGGATGLTGIFENKMSEYNLKKAQETIESLHPTLIQEKKDRS